MNKSQTQKSTKGTRGVNLRFSQQLVTLKIEKDRELKHKPTSFMNNYYII